MAELTAQLIATEERRTADYYERLAVRARKAGDTGGARNYDKLAAMAREQAERVQGVCRTQGDKSIISSL